MLPHVAHCFAVRTEVSFERNTSLWEWNEFVKRLSPANQSFLLEIGYVCSNKPNSAKLK
jgi:hypothetical protein